jgi:hypothetical protein
LIDCRKWDAYAGVHVLLAIFRAGIMNIWITIFSCHLSANQAGDISKQAFHLIEWPYGCSAIFVSSHSVLPHVIVGAILWDPKCPKCLWAVPFQMFLVPWGAPSTAHNYI